MPAEKDVKPKARRCQIVTLGVCDERRGSLCVAEVGRQIAFPIRRVYWIFDVPSGGERARHAHRVQQELLVAVNGSFVVHCYDGVTRTSFELDSPDKGLLLGPMVFHHADAFAPGSICLVLASGPYEPDEYVRDYEEFRALTAPRC
jgi:hypothetical protein